MVSNIQAKFFALNVRRDGPQPSICVQSFRSFTTSLKRHFLTYNSTALTQFSTAMTGKSEENSEQMNEIVTLQFSADLWLMSTFGDR
jgi:hypothetical protein